MKKDFLYLKIKSLIIISPTKLFLKKIKDALGLIQKTDLKEYRNIFSRLNIIFVTNKNDYTNEFFMPEKIWFANKLLIKNNDINWLASLIIHEAFHATQFKNGKYIFPLGEKLEKPAIELQKKFLEKLEGKKVRKETKYLIQKKYWRKIEDDKKSFSYFRNLLYLFQNKKINLKRVIASRN
jgi:hypothetical protein